MNEDINTRLKALEIAIHLSKDLYEDVYQDIFPLAESIYKFLKGELPNE